MINDSENIKQPEFTVQKSKVARQLKAYVNEDVIEVLNLINNEIENIADEERPKWMKEKLTAAHADKLPLSVIEYMVGFLSDGDSEAALKKPEWLDIEKFHKGQKFAANHFFKTSYSQMLSLFVMFTLDNGLKTLIATNMSSTPYASLKRYLSTISRVYNWVTSDPWVPNTKAYNDICYVRRIHKIVRENMINIDDEELAEKVKIKNLWSPALNKTRKDFKSIFFHLEPTVIINTYFNSCPNIKFKYLSQSEMSLTQFVFNGFIILKPDYFGLNHASDEELEALCHLWRGIGYLLGIKDKYNFYRGSLTDIKTRLNEILEYCIKPNLQFINVEWEHMMRCVIEGVSYYAPGFSYKNCLLDFAELLNISMPQIYETLSFYEKIKRFMFRFTFKYGSRIFGLNKLLNYISITSLKKAQKFDKLKNIQLQNKSSETLKSY